MVLIKKYIGDSYENRLQMLSSEQNRLLINRNNTKQNSEELSQPSPPQKYLSIVFHIVIVIYHNHLDKFGPHAIIG